MDFVMHLMLIFKNALCGFLLSGELTMNICIFLKYSFAAKLAISFFNLTEIELYAS